MRLLCLLSALMVSASALAQDAIPPVHEVDLNRQETPALVGQRALQPDCPVSWCAKGVDLTVEIQDDQGASFVPVMRSGYGYLATDKAHPPRRLVFNNNSFTRVMVLFSINGKNPLDGGKAILKSKGYVVPARGQLEVSSTALPGKEWFSAQWPASGNMHISVFKESSNRPIPGTNDHEPPPEAVEYLKDPTGRSHWVPPQGFPFRHDGRRLEPVSSTYWSYEIISPDRLPQEPIQP